jgi:hypothetical protein
MNSFFQLLYPGSLLPWFIIGIYHLLKGSILYFLLIAVHVLTHMIIVLHVPVLKSNMINWNRILHVQRLVLILTYGLRNISDYYCTLFTVMLIISMLILVKQMEPYRNKITSVIVHNVILLTFCSTASLFQFVLAVLCGACHYFACKPLKLSWKMNDSLSKYYTARIGYNYIMFVLEWSTSPLNWTSLPIILSLCIIFNVIIVHETPITNIDNSDDYLDPNIKIPHDYPYPLNIKEAKRHCEITKNLFKSHTL